ncbi:WD40 repeat domain-containing protein [Vibrio scophthalmi]|uniref:WD40 repeat domain-containing protein n=1 Tax=Vibrio scophthalmi TaxID=45658 RepID=UPI003EBE4882
MRIIFNSLLIGFVITALNGCFFWASDDQRWELEPQGTTSFALSRDARFALAYSKEHQLVLWDLYQSQQLASLGAQDQQANTVSRIRISDNGRYAITATQFNFAVWDLAWSQSQGLWSISDGTIRDVDISSNGEQVLLGLSNGKAIHVNLVTGRRIEFLAHNEKVNSVALSPNGRFALTGGNDYTAYIWDTTSGQIQHTFNHDQRVNRVALHRDGKYAFSSDGGNHAVVWDLVSGKEVSQLSSFSRQLIFSSARFSDDGLQLITGTPSSRVMVWDSLTGKRLEGFEAEPLKDARPPRAVVYDAAFDNQHRVVSGTSAGIAQAWTLD